MLIPPLNPLSAHAPHSVVTRREKRSLHSSPPEEKVEQDEGASESDADEREKESAFDGFAQALHDAQADSGPCDDSAPLPEDAHDPQELCAFLDPAE